jgi:proteasome assembly chaperone (PAC2) family protein
MTSALTIRDMPAGLRRPVMILAFSGWNDAAEAASTAARFLASGWDARRFAEIDPEEFYHFGLTRPTVRFKAESSAEREIVWPTTDFWVAQGENLPRDVIIGVAPEPHLRWKTYCGLMLDLARRCEVSLVLTVGALLAAVPHTRPVRLVGGASDPELATRLGVRPTRYEGPTGIVGVLGTICRDQGMPTGSLWANVPHYINGVDNPKAALALVRRVLAFLPADLDVSPLVEGARQFDDNLREIVKQNAKIAAYIKQLEQGDADEEPADAMGDLPPSDNLVAEIEQFLRQQNPE